MLSDVFPLASLELARGRVIEALKALDFGATTVVVRVIRTDEEWIIAKTVCRVLALTRGKENKL